MYKLIFLRHGSTQGNLEGRYVGRTDESLCEKGIDQLAKSLFPHVDIVFSSPMKRCLETAQIVYQDKPLYTIEDAKECDFGDFENKNYKELHGNKEYQKWLDSNASLPFPNGEEVTTFKRRSLHAFTQMLNIMKGQSVTCAAMITHGGVIMSIMEAYSTKAFYDFQIKNGHGFEVLYAEGKFLEVQKI